MFAWFPIQSSALISFARAPFTACTEGRNLRNRVRTGGSRTSAPVPPTGGITVLSLWLHRSINAGVVTCGRYTQHRVWSRNKAHSASFYYSSRTLSLYPVPVWSGGGGSVSEARKVGTKDGRLRVSAGTADLQPNSRQGKFSSHTLLSPVLSPNLVGTTQGGRYMENKVINMDAMAA